MPLVLTKVEEVVEGDDGAVNEVASVDELDR